MPRFTPDWEPTLLGEKVVASGVWKHQNVLEYKAELVRQTYNYTSLDIPVLEEVLDIVNLDCVDYSISDTGSLYFWRFTRQGERNVSRTFATYFGARDHINTYAGSHEIDWLCPTEGST